MRRPHVSYNSSSKISESIEEEREDLKINKIK